MSYLLLILANENPDDHVLWAEACKLLKNIVKYRIVDLTKNDWLEKIREKPFDMLLARPPGISSLFKQLYDERIYILARVLNYPVYPSLDEVLIYENKRLLSYWLKANKLPHPETYVSYDREDALEFLSKTIYPVVAKTNIGASGSGVKIIHNKKEGIKYITEVFSDKGYSRRWGPNFSKGNILKRGFHYIQNPHDIKKKVNIYQKARQEKQRDFVIFQKFIKHDYEWRIVVIGDSYFAHKKLKIGEKASGSTRKNYDNSPLKLFDFAKETMESSGFLSQAIDVFETEEGELLINEMQCFFGQSDPYQMLVDGKPGRYRYLNGQWVFEEGMFNTNECYDLRLNHVLQLLKRKHLG